MLHKPLGASSYIILSDQGVNSSPSCVCRKMKRSQDKFRPASGSKSNVTGRSVTFSQALVCAMHELLADRLSRRFAASAVTYVQQSISIACYSFLKRVTFARYYVSPFKSDFCLPPLTGNALYRQFIRSGQATNQGCSYTRELSEMWLSDMSVQGHRLMRHVHPVPQCWLLTLVLQLKQAMQKLPCCNQKKKTVAVVVVLAATPSSANCTYLAGWFTEPATYYAFTQSSGQVLRLLCSKLANLRLWSQRQRALAACVRIAY